MSNINVITVTAYDFFDVTEEVERRLGKDTRDYARIEGKSRSEFPYQDFWHKFLKFHDTTFKGNDSFCMDVCFMSMKEYFAEKEPEETWIGEICDMYYEVMGQFPESNESPWVDGAKCYNFWISW
jgi:hypothetical protein